MKHLKTFKQINESELFTLIDHEDYYKAIPAMNRQLLYWRTERDIEFIKNILLPYGFEFDISEFEVGIFVDLKDFDCKIFISKDDDDWFYVDFVYKSRSNLYKCDQLDGLEICLNTYIKNEIL